MVNDESGAMGSIAALVIDDRNVLDVVI